MGALPQVVKYRVGSLDKERWSAPSDADKALATLKQKAEKLGGEWQFAERGKPFGPTHTRVEASRRLMAAIKKDKVGSVYILKGLKGEIAVRKIHTQPAIMDTPGTGPVDIAHTAIVNKFPSAHSWGICSCRNVAGSSSYSQHAYCNAEDWNASKAVMKAIANFLVRNHKKLRVAHVIYAGRIWTKGVGWRPYTGVNPHNDHVHVDFTPQSPGRPCQ